MAKWGNTATNTFFRIVYKGPLWLPKSSAQSAIENGWNMCVPRMQEVRVSYTTHRTKSRVSDFEIPLPVSEEAYGALARLCKEKQWRLFYIRPKIHMMQHVVLLCSI